jgi:hypothetical protein
MLTQRELVRRSFCPFDPGQAVSGVAQGAAQIEAANITEKGQLATAQAMADAQAKLEQQAFQQQTQYADSKEAALRNAITGVIGGGNPYAATKAPPPRFAAGGMFGPAPAGGAPPPQTPPGGATPPAAPTPPPAAAGPDLTMKPPPAQMWGQGNWGTGPGQPPAGSVGTPDNFRPPSMPQVQTPPTGGPTPIFPSQKPPQPTMTPQRKIPDAMRLALATGRIAQ